jgi:dienelactone hydrolase
VKGEKQTYFFENKWGIYSAALFSPPEESNRFGSVIVFAHGFRAQKEWYQWLGDCLASHGYFALLFTVPSQKCRNPQQWSDGIRSAINYMFREQESLPDTMSPEKTGVMGHSIGGLGALLAGSVDSRIKCIVGLAPAILPEHLNIPKELYRVPIPIQLQIGSNDGIIPPKNVKTFFNDLRSKQKSFIEIEGGNHMRFLDKTTTSTIGEYVSRLGVLGRRLKDGRATISFEEQHSISRNGFIEWFDCYL